jgi:hypothetical protein
MLSKEVKKNVQEYRDEYSKWLKELNKYHTKFSENYEKYVGYNQVSGTDSKVSDPVAAELIERVIQKLFERDPKFFVEAKGTNLPREVKNVMASAVEWMWSNQDTIQSTGPMRNKLKVGGRELLILNNTAFEVYWNHVSDAPDMRVVPVEDIIFDPTKNLKTSPVYYIRRFVSLDYLEDNVEIKSNGEVVTGIFDSAAIKKLKRDKAEDTYKLDPTNVKVKRHNSDFGINVDPLELITRYKGNKVCQFINAGDDDEPVAVREYVNEVLDTHPLAFAIDKEVVKEPYGSSLVDDLAGLLKAKNLFINQEIAYRSKVLNPPMYIDPSVATNPISMRTLGNAYKNGGIVIANKEMVDHKTIPSLGNAGLDILNWIEGRAESISGINSYMAGVPNSQTDKTQGTKGGIEALINQATSPVSDRQQNIEESIIEPIVNKWLKMLGATMTKDEFKWVMISGEKPSWVKLTKGFITGKIKLIDLMQADLIEAPEVQAIVDLMISEGKDPSSDTVFDIDWMVKVETGSLAEQDSGKEIAKKQSVIEMGLGMGLMIDKEKVWKELAADAGMKEPEQYLNKEAMMPQGGIDGGAGIEGPAGAVGGSVQPPVGPGVQPGLSPVA